MYQITIFFPQFMELYLEISEREALEVIGHALRACLRFTVKCHGG